MADLSEVEIRLRLIEAAARAPIVHQDGPVAGVLATAKAWGEWVDPAPNPAKGVDTLL
jgi:hypothetical protein